MPAAGASTFRLRLGCLEAACPLPLPVFDTEMRSSFILATPAYALVAVSIALASLSLTLAKDPAEGWLGYATAISPTGSGRITFAEAYWVVPENPHEGGAFYSPWFGIEVPSP